MALKGFTQTGPSGGPGRGPQRYVSPAGGTVLSEPCGVSWEMRWNRTWGWAGLPQSLRRVPWPLPRSEGARERGPPALVTACRDRGVSTSHLAGYRPPLPFITHSFLPPPALAPAVPSLWGLVVRVPSPLPATHYPRLAPGAPSSLQTPSSALHPPWVSPPPTVGCPPGLPFWLPPQSLHPAGCPVCHTVAPSPREPPRPVWSPEPPEQPGCPA